MEETRKQTRPQWTRPKLNGCDQACFRSWCTSNKVEAPSVSLRPSEKPTGGRPTKSLRLPCPNAEIGRRHERRDNWAVPYRSRMITGEARIRRIGPHRELGPRPPNYGRTVLTCPWGAPLYGYLEPKWLRTVSLYYKLLPLKKPGVPAGKPDIPHVNRGPQEVPLLRHRRRV